MAEPPALLPCDRLGASPAVGWVVAGCAVVWLWIQYCRFPLSAWNDVRLVPVFMMMAGVPVYTLPGEGVLTTWMYGPVPLWLMAPVTWAGDTVTALLVAGAWNQVLLAGAVVATCLGWPAKGVSMTTRVVAAGLAGLMWPEARGDFCRRTTRRWRCRWGRI